MEEIPPGLLHLLKETFKKCDDVFLENRDLWRIFSDSRLHIWQDHLPEASNVGQRIERTIHYLQNKGNARGENGLMLLIHVLSERYPSHDERQDLLLTIFHKLDPTTPPTQPEEQYSILTHANPAQEPMISISELEPIRQCALSIALIEVTRYRNGKDEYRETGTGWLIAPGLVLTCWHVVAALASEDEPSPTAPDLKLQIKHMLLTFNQIKASKGGTQYQVKALEYPLNEADQQKDFAVLRLEDRCDQPYGQFGYLPVELDTPFTRQTQLSIIQHPFGRHQQIAINGYFISRSRRVERILYTTVTETGTSGAPVLNRHNLCTVALHNGENKEASLREGTTIKYILSELQGKKPDLYKEIVEAQRTLNNPLPSVHPTKPPDPRVPSTETTFHASFYSTTSPFINRDAIYPPNTDQKPIYSYLSNFKCSYSILSLTFHPKGQYLASGDNSGAITVWDMPTTKLSYALKNYTNATSSIAFSRDGHYLASGGDDGSIKIWDFLSQTIEKTLQWHTERISCLAFSPDGQHLVSGCDGGSIKVWESPYWVSVHHQKESLEVLCVAFKPGDQLIASCHSGQPMKLWSIFSSRARPFKEPLIGVRSLVFSPDGRYLATGNDEGYISIYDTTTWKAIHTLTKHTNKIRCLAFHPDSQLLASGSDDYTIQLWNAQTGTAIQMLAKHTGRIESIAFSPDGGYLASGGRDTNIILWKCV